jgi:IclR family KDG regulon transcriptional repressor
MSVQSVHRAIDILSLFSTARPWLGVTEISQALNLPKPTIHGLLKTLASRGFLTKDPDSRKYSLGLNIYELGTILAGSLRVNQVAAEPAQRLARQTGLVARVAIWDHETVLVTMNLFPQASEPMPNNLGPRLPAYCSAVGKAVLAFLPPDELTAYMKKVQFMSFTPNTITTKKQLREDLKTARKFGYSSESGEFLLGLACIGAPLFDRSGGPVGSISLSGAPGEMTDDVAAARAPELLAIAREISGYLGYQIGTPGL